MAPPNVIVVPLYKDVLNKFEYISLQQCFKIFDTQLICAIKPNSLDLTSLLNEFPFQNIISFDDSYFEDIHGYNKLMMSTLFYEKFLSYNYMLIYQPDAFVFSDKLNYWVNAGYDYIGAPWLRPLKTNSALNQLFLKLKSDVYTKFNIKKAGLPRGKQFFNKVGNGGFSLRNIKKFHELSISKKKTAEYYINLRNPAFNEDIFWSVEVNRQKKKLNIPNYKRAVQFSIETFPEYAFSLNNYELPFGCHAWEKQLDFWKDKIEKEGYTIQL
ncbi:MAG: DUF5672 family protein [Bacteroidota bacterium]